LSFTSVEHLSLNENSAYVGASVTLRGDLIASDTVVVERTVEGNVTADSVFVGANGAIKGSLSAADAEIKGFLPLRSTGRKISCGDLEVERGAMIDGAFTVGNSLEPHVVVDGSAESAAAQAMPEIPSGVEATNGANGSAAASL
jgi:cytoskeletal protein CcmA (bactofilin family)